MKVKSLSLVVCPAEIPKWERMASMMESEPQPPSWQGVLKEGRLTFSLWIFGKRRAAYCRANLDVKTSDRRTIVHGVERSNLVDPHGGHLQNSCNLVHDANARESMLALPQIKERHHGGLLILWGVATEDLRKKLLIRFIEFEFKGRVVV